MSVSLFKDDFKVNLVDADLSIFSANSKIFSITAPMMCCNVGFFAYILLHLSSNNVIILFNLEFICLNLPVLKATIRPGHYESEIVIWVERYLSYRLLCDGTHRVPAYPTGFCHVTSQG